MLQRQIMFKQLQELQRRQQLQELGGARINHDYVDQLTSSKQPSAVQLAPSRDSRMLMFDNMQMIQQGESGIFQGPPSGLVLSQGQSNALGPMGLSSPQFDMSLYGNPAPYVDNNLDQYHYPHEPSNFYANLSTKDHNSPHGNFSADQSTIPDGSLLSSQVFHEKNLFGEVPFQNSNSNLVSLSYSPQGITTQRSTSEGRLEDTGWPVDSPGEVSKVDMSEDSVTLDPLEQKILYSSDDHGWLSSFGTSSKMGAGDFECTVENGSWSALMQSAVTETSSSGTAVQEEWSGLSFQNPEPSSDNHPSNLSTGEKLHDNWVDRNLQNVTSPSSEPEQFPRPNMSHSFPGSQHSGKQFLTQKDEFHCESSLVSGQCSPRTVSQLSDYNSHLKHPTGRDQLVQSSLLSENTLNAQYNDNFKNDHELKDSLWHSNSASGGFQTPFGQFNQPNFHRYSVESEKMVRGDNVDPSSAHVVGASDLYGQNVAAQSTVPSSQEFGFRPGPADSRTQQSYSLYSSLPMHVGFPTGLPPLGPNVTTQQDVSSPRTNKFPSSLFQTPGSASSSLETNPRAPEQASLNFSKHGHSVGYHEQRLEHNPTSLSSNTDSQQSLSRHYLEVDGVSSGSYMRHTPPRPSDQVEQKNVATAIVSVSDSRASSHPPRQNYSVLHQFHRSTDGQTVSGKRFPFNYQQETANARELLLGGENVAVKDKVKSSIKGVQLGAFSPANDIESFMKESHDQPRNASSTGYLQNSQQMVMLGQNDSQSPSIDSKEASSVAYEFHTSLQMAPSWFKQYEDLKNGQALATAAMPSFSGLSIGNIPENRLNIQIGSANTAQGSDAWPSSAVTSIASKHLSPPSMLSSDITCQNLAMSNVKKRKIVAHELEPWHKELHSEAPMPQNISIAEFEWAQALNRRQEEARNEADIVVDVLPVVRAKRRLIFTTQLMQQVFRPLVATILIGDDSSICVAYSAARTALGDACNLNSKTPSDSVSPDKINTSKRTSPYDFSKIVGCLISRAEKLEGDLSRLDQRLSIVDINVESQELEKFSILNRFAKFHFRPQSSTGDPAQKTNPQRYVTASPMPKILPEDGECISL